MFDFFMHMLNDIIKLSHKVVGDVSWINLHSRLRKFSAS